MSRPRSSTLVLAALVAVALVLVAGVLALGRTSEPGGRTVVTVRLWDQQVAAAYRESFAQFSREHPDIEVRTDVVSYATYFDTLRTDVAGGGADDIFWINNANFAEYADNARLLPIDPSPASWPNRFSNSGAVSTVPRTRAAGASCR